MAGCSKLVQPSVTANILNVADQRIPRLNQQGLASFVVDTVPSMSEKDIDVKLMFSAIILRDGVKPMDP